MSARHWAKVIIIGGGYWGWVGHRHRRHDAGARVVVVTIEQWWLWWLLLLGDAGGWSSWSVLWSSLRVLWVTIAVVVSAVGVDKLVLTCVGPVVGHPGSGGNHVVNAGVSSRRWSPSSLSSGWWW